MFVYLPPFATVYLNLFGLDGQYIDLFLTCMMPISHLVSTGLCMCSDWLALCFCVFFFFILLNMPLHAS